MKKEYVEAMKKQNSTRPTVKIGPQTADTVEVYIGDVRIVASETDVRIEANGKHIEVLS